MSDIVERLRTEPPISGQPGATQLRNEAANEIERLRTENDAAHSLIIESRQSIQQLSADNERLWKALEVIATNPYAATSIELQNYACSALITGGNEATQHPLLTALGIRDN